MSANILSYVWHNSKAKGSARLVLAALADHADHKGEVCMSQRDLGQLVALSKTSVVEATEKLIEIGELRIVGGGKGRGNPLRYWVTGVHKRYYWSEQAPVIEVPSISEPTAALLENPKEAERALSDSQTKPEQTKKAPPPPALPQLRQERRVPEVLQAAGIKSDPAQPFYWGRKAHEADLDQLLTDLGCSYDALLNSLRAAAPVPQDPPIRRLTRLADFVRVKR